MSHEPRPVDPVVVAAASASLNRLGKWRMILAGWQLGTRPKGDPESDAVRDHREATMLLRAEVTALTRVLVEKGVCDRETLLRLVGEEAEYLSQAYEERFPGAKATDDGISLDPVEFTKTTTRMGFRP